MAASFFGAVLAHSRVELQGCGILFAEVFGVFFWREGFGLEGRILEDSGHHLATEPPNNQDITRNESPNGDYVLSFLEILPLFLKLVCEALFCEWVAVWSCFDFCLRLGCSAGV